MSTIERVRKLQAKYGTHGQEPISKLLKIIARRLQIAQNVVESANQQRKPK
jgi:hypothetical protein